MKPEEPAGGHRKSCGECNGFWHTYAPGCFLEGPPPGPPDIPWKTRIEYLSVKSGFANDPSAPHFATLADARRDVEYAKRWAPNRPHRIVKVTIKYEYVEDK